MLPLKPLKQVIQDYDLAPKKALGQNFLLNPVTTDRIASIPRLKEGDLVLEVGPGPGGLTRSLLAKGFKVIAVEHDVRCIKALQELKSHYPDTFTLIHGDALKVSLKDLVEGDQKLAIVANLPYNVGTPLFINWLGELQYISSMTLMFQKEVAERLIAPVNSDGYGRLSVMTQWVMEGEIAMDLSPESFTPAPKVMSSVVHLKPLNAPVGDVAVTWASMEAVTRAAFGQRRKMLRASLKTLVSKPESLLVSAGIDGTLRAEALTVDQFCDLALEYQRV